jgi:hypothetical protein
VDRPGPNEDWARFEGCRKRTFAALVSITPHVEKRDHLRHGSVRISQLIGSSLLALALSEPAALV